jgi:c-di-GMP-binding flagellar brake protein YcgR
LRQMTQVQIQERRQDPRIEITEALVTITPLSAVTNRVRGMVVDVSARGLKVHADGISETSLVNGDVYRVQSGDDLMLCEMRHRRFEGDSGDIGFAILHWVSAGKLNRLVNEFTRLTA